MTRPQAKRRTPSNKDFSVFSKPSFSSYRSDSVYCTVALFIIIIIGIQPLGRFWAETRAQSVNWYSSGTLHHGQVLRGSLPLLSPAFRRSHSRHQVCLMGREIRYLFYLCSWNQKYGRCSYLICCFCFGLSYSPATAMTYFFRLQSASYLHFAIHCTFNLTNCDTCVLQCIWVGPKMKEEKELILYPNKNGTVADLLEEARKQVELSENGSGKLRYISTLER